MISIVFGSTTLTAETFVTYCDGWSFRLISRSNVHFTSSAVTGLPLLNFASVRWKRQPLPSAVFAQDFASAGFTSR